MFKRVIRQTANRLGFDITRLEATESQLVQAYMEGDKRPWTNEYSAYKNQFITQVLDDPGLLQIMKGKKELPAGFGIGIDERCIEYPWLFAMLDNKATTVLDAGSALNHGFILDRDHWHNRKLTICTMAPEARCYWHRGVSYQFADLCDMPFRDECFDEVVCISTLEHVGMDNSFYLQQTVSTEQQSERYAAAILEMRRVLEPGGQLLLSVPYGKHVNYGMFQQFDAAMLDHALDTFQPVNSDLDIFSYSVSGWQRSDRESCQNCEYSKYALSTWRQDNEQAGPEIDKAAAARAVACLMLRKE